MKVNSFLKGQPTCCRGTLLKLNQDLTQYQNASQVVSFCRHHCSHSYHFATYFKQKQGKNRLSTGLRTPWQVLKLRKINRKESAQLCHKYEVNERLHPTSAFLSREQLTECCRHTYCAALGRCHQLTAVQDPMGGFVPVQPPGNSREKGSYAVQEVSWRYVRETQGAHVV